MEPQQLKDLVARYKSNRAFIAAFNAATDGEYLHETTLSRQLGGSIKISGAWTAAYQLFTNMGDAPAKNKQMYYLLDFSQGTRPVIKDYSETPKPGFVHSDDVPSSTMPYMPTAPGADHPMTIEQGEQWRKKVKRFQSGESLKSIFPK